VRAHHRPDRPSLPGAGDHGGATDHPRQTRKITDAGIPYRIPADDELTARLPAVLTVIYLLLNEGYLSTAQQAQSRDLVDDAEWLATLLHQLMPTEPEVAGLLIRLHRARAADRRALRLTSNPAEQAVLQQRISWT
jgi:predicted RNA polymerase sigma factor